MNKRVEGRTGGATYDEAQTWSEERRSTFDRLNRQGGFSFFLPGEGFWRKHVAEHCDRPLVLDAGCGSGAFLKLLGKVLWQQCQCPANLTGIDIARDLIGWAEEAVDASGIIPRFQYGNYLDQTSFSGQQFDVIHISQAIFGNDRLLESLRKIKELLKPGGKLIIQEPTLEDFQVFPLRNLYHEIVPRWSEMIRRMQENCINMWGVPQRADQFLPVLGQLGFVEVWENKSWIPSGGSLSPNCGFFHTFESFLPTEDERKEGRAFIDYVEGLHCQGRRSRSYITARKA